MSETTTTPAHHQATAPVEHKNAFVQSVVLLHPDCRVEFRVKAEASLINAAKHAALREVAKEVTLPGFRKGKAPEQMVIKQYSKEIEKRVPNHAADLAFQETAKMAKIPLLNNNSKVSFDLKNISNEHAEMVFQFETEPKVPEIDPKGFVKKEVQKAEVGEKQIDEAIRQALFFFANWTAVEDRPIQEKDTVIIDLDTIDGDVPTRVFHQIRFEVTKERMAEWMHRLVIGAKTGDVLEGMSEVDADATEKEKAEFQPKKVRVTILKVEEAHLPELDDAFAQKMGAKDVAHMRQMITDMLNSQADQGAKEQLREQVSHYLLDNYHFDLPKSLVQAEKEHREHQVKENPRSRKEWEQMSSEEKATFQEKLWKESSQAVRLFYLSRQMVHQAKIGISRQEVQKVAIETIQMHGGSPVAVDQIPKEIYALAFSKVMLIKAQDYILDQVATQV